MMTVKKKLEQAAEAFEDAASVAMGGKGEFGYGETPGYVESFPEDELAADAKRHGDRLIAQQDGSHLVEEVTPDRTEEVHEYPSDADR